MQFFNFSVLLKLLQYGPLLHGYEISQCNQIKFTFTEHWKISFHALSSADPLLLTAGSNLCEVKRIDFFSTKHGHGDGVMLYTVRDFTFLDASMATDLFQPHLI